MLIKITSYSRLDGLSLGWLTRVMADGRVSSGFVEGGVGRKGKEGDGTRMRSPGSPYHGASFAAAKQWFLIHMC